MIHDFSTSVFVQSCGWSLVHFLWQGTLIAIIVWVALAIANPKRSSLRYAIACVALVAMLCCPIGTTVWLLSSNGGNASLSRSTLGGSVSNELKRHGSSPPVFAAPVEVSARLATNEFSPESDNIDATTAPIQKTATTSRWDSIRAIAERYSPSIESAIPALMLIWILSVFVMSLRLMFSWQNVRHLQRSGELVTDSQILERLNRLRSELNIRIAIPLRASIAIHSPSVVGYLKPVILLPLSAVTGLSQVQLTAILAHELAHIRRADYLVNLIQTMIEILLFYHPAVWWLSGKIRQERENCCDDLTIEVCPDKRQYIEALLLLEQNRADTIRLAMASDGANLVKRIARMLGDGTVRRKRTGSLAGFIILAMLGILLLGAVVERISAQSAAVLEAPTAIPNVEAPRQDPESSDTQGPRTMQVRVVAPDQSPVVGAEITLGVWYHETASTEHFVTDAEGVVAIKIPAGYRIVRIWAGGVGFTPLFAHWEEDQIKEGFLPPEEFTIPMVKAVAIGGTVVDENGNPIPGVKVEVRRQSSATLGDDKIIFSSSYSLGADAIRTDEQGTWSLYNTPPGDDIGLSIKLTHPEFISDENYGEIQAKHAIGITELRKKTAKFVLQNGVRVRGKVTDEDGNPIGGALVVRGDKPYNQPGSQELYANSDGTYQTPTQKDGKLRITIVAPGYAPDTKVIEIVEGMGDTDFVLSAGKNLQIRFVDAKGKPVPDVYVGIEGWRRSESLYNHRHPNVLDSRIPRKSDDKGLYTWDWAPRDAVKYSYGARGYISHYDVEWTASDEPLIVTLQRPMVISGSVTDESGVAIESFRVIPREHRSLNRVMERRHESVNGRHGEFNIELEKEAISSLKVEAEGFESQSTEAFDRASQPETIVLKLKKSTSKPIRVVNQNGEPVSNATIVVAPKDGHVSLNGYNDQFTIKRALNTMTNEEGEFELPTSSAPRTIMVIAEEGYGEVAEYPTQPVNEIAIKKWASLDAFLIKRGEPWKARYSLGAIRYLHGSSHHIQMRIPGRSNSNGRFQIPEFAAMANVVSLSDPNDDRGLQCRLAFESHPGETFELDFSNAIPLTAKLKLMGSNKTTIDLTRSRFRLRRIEPSVDFPPELVKELRDRGLENSEFEEISEALRAIENKHAAAAYESCFDSYIGPLEENGNLSVDVLRTGKYVLSFSLYARSDSDVIIQESKMSDFRQIIEIGQPVVDLGELEIAIFDSPIPDSDIADFDFLDQTDDSTHSLSDFRGKYVLIDFWTARCDLCERDTPKVERLARSLARKGKTTIIGLKSKWLGPLIRIPPSIPDGLTWIDGRMTSEFRSQVRKQLGVWTSQHFVLVDPEGKFVTGGSFAKVVNKMEELGLK